MFRGYATAGTLLHATRNPAGFDYLRLVLSFGVLAFHCILVTQGDTGEKVVWASYWRALPAAILPMFFALSGFLVAGSVLRSTLPEFVAARVVRIVPALATEVALSALLLGLCVTTLPVADYLRSADLWRYFLNVIGWIHFKLPGVFASNPEPKYVNLSLWTIPYELECYVALIGATVIGLVRRSRMFVAALLGLHGAVFLWDGLNLKKGMAGFQDALNNGVIGVDESMPPRVLVLAFLSGVALHIWRDRLVLSSGCMALAAALTAVLLTFPIGAYFVSLPAAYLTICLGLMNPPRHWIVKSGDYSYDVYLYAFPIQQTVVHLGPSLGPVEVFLIAAPLCFLAATFSWHVIEKPCLALRHILVARRRVAAAA